MTTYKYGDLQFDEDFVFARRECGEEIKFSRHERALLACFLAMPGQLLSRQQLLDSIHEHGSDSSDRNIDYLLSRLRRKLGDSSRSPHYIATQYGEGYIWIAKENCDPAQTDEKMYLSVGPVHHGGAPDFAAGPFLNKLTEALRSTITGPRIEMFPFEQEDTALLQQHYDSQYSLEFSLLNRGSVTTVTAILVERNSDQVLDTFQVDLPHSHRAEETGEIHSSLAMEIRDQLWNEKIYRTTARNSMDADPLSVGMYKASTLFEPSSENFTEVEQKLRQRLEKATDDHHAAIMLVANLHAQFNSIEVDHRREWRQESESLIFEHLTGIQDDPLYLAYAAERLDDIGHHAIAEQLAEQALDIGPGFAACYMVVGRTKIHRGNTEEGLAYYNQSLSMTEQGSIFYRMLLTMKALALLAEGRSKDSQDIMVEVIAQEPEPMRQLVMKLFFFTNDSSVMTEDLIAAAKTIPAELAHNLLLGAYHLFAQPFLLESGRCNIMGPGTQLLVDLHGPDVLPDMLRQSMPSVFSSLPQA